MQKFCMFFSLAVIFVALTGCNSTNYNPATSSTNSNSVPVSLSITDDPPQGVSVLFFQVSLTAASLTPASGQPVSLLSGNVSIPINVTDLQALSAFLSTVNVPPGTYNSLNLTFASPLLVIYNQSDASIASTCAVGSVCQLTPTVDNSATVALSSAPFPVTISTGSQLGFMVDFHLNTIIQSDLSVNLGAANGISVVQLTPPATHTPVFGSIAGVVQTVTAGSSQFTILTSWGRTFTIDTSSSTTYGNFPSSDCAAEGFSCIAVGQSVQVQVESVAGADTLTAGSVIYLQAAGQQTVEGTIVGLNVTGSTQTLHLVLHNCPSNDNTLPLGGIATVTIASNATFSIDSAGFTLPAGLTFTGTGNLLIGQDVTVDVVTGSLSNTTTTMTNGWGPPEQLSFTTDMVELEPGQITGTVSAIDSSMSSFTLTYDYIPCGIGNGPATCNVIEQVQDNVETTTQTTYQNFSSDSFSGLQTGDWVSVRGWLFPTEGDATQPTIVPETVVLHEDGFF